MSDTCGDYRVLPMSLKAWEGGGGRGGTVPSALEGSVMCVFLSKITSEN